MAELTEAQQREYERLRAIKDRISDEYLRRPGVRGVGVGFKETGGRETDRLAIRFYVAEKRPVSELERLPGELEGVPTDVIEADFRLARVRVPAVRAYRERRREAGEPEDVEVAASLPDTKKYDPLVGGISVGPSREIDGGYVVGTEGVMVSDVASGKPVMLSNYHVMCGNDGNAQRGDEMCQPSRVDATFQWCSNCARLERWFLGNALVEGTEYGVDGAVALRTHREVTLRNVVDIGNLTGTGAARVNMVVEKRGRTTGLTTGVVTDVALDGSEDFGPPYGTVILRNQILVQGQSGAFMQGGDSGSLLVEKSTLKAVGLCWASASGGKGVASPIAAVLEVLDINL